jgi:hypothetical protein
VGSIPEDGSGGAAPLMWALLVLATWCDAHGIA